MLTDKITCACGLIKYITIVLTESSFGKHIAKQQANGEDFLGETVQTVNPNGSSSVVLICEHASRDIPPEFQNLGLSLEASKSHAAWDPGAMAVAQHLSKILDAVLIASTVSRLVYDCNRPPDAADAMSARSELVDVPGNVDLSQNERAERIRLYYEPFRKMLAERTAQTDTAIVVTVHSFTPIYYGKKREVEIGVLHDTDARLADAMLECSAQHTLANVQRNQPYGPQDGVTHTLKEHAIPHGYLNVMLEIRNDLIGTAAEQRAMADMIAGWIADAFSRTSQLGRVKCMA